MRSVVRFADQTWRDHTAIVTLALLALAYLFQEGIRGPAIDFSSLWEAGRSITNGESPYSEETVVGDFVQPPGTAILIAPLAILSLSAAGKVVVALSFFAFFVGTYASARSTWSTAALAITLVGFAFATPLRTELELGNTDLIAAGCYGVCVLMLARRREIPAGLALGLGLSLKPTMVLLLALPLLVGQWRATVVAGALVAFFNAVGMLLVPESTRFFTSALPYITEGSTGGFNVTLQGSLDRLGAPDAAIMLARVVVAGVVAWACWRFRDGLRASPALAALVLVVATPLVSSYFFSAYFVYLIAACGAIALVSHRREIAVVSAGAFLVLAPFVFRSDSPRLDDLLAFRWVAGCAALLIAAFLIAHRLSTASPLAEPMDVERSRVSVG